MLTISPLGMPETPYRGRFAPSPTGPLHFGSLVAATASYLQARSTGGQWWLRIEDIDPPREVPGASDAILVSLEAFGFEWDGPVQFQRQRQEHYLAVFERLRAQDLVYPCACSRKTLAETGSGEVYPGTCRQGLALSHKPRAWRLKVPDNIIEFPDVIQGYQRFPLTTTVGDFILRRADGLFAYQLATALDDAEQGITEVVRGADLLDSTPRQRIIQQVLGLNSPNYAHHPVVNGHDGHKLSKQNQATALDNTRPGPQLYRALHFLGQAPPAALQQADADELWSWAKSNWNIAKVPKVLSQPLEKTTVLSDTKTNSRE